LEGLGNSGRNHISHLASLVTLNHLELRLCFPYRAGGDVTLPGGLLSHQMPNLRTLILDGLDHSNPNTVKEFLLNHPDLQKLSLSDGGQRWLPKTVEDMLPNLTVLSVSIILHVSSQCNLQSPFSARSEMH
jgi:hypothetical protein